VRSGIRLDRVEGLADLVEPVSAIARERLGAAANPVRAVLFDKSPQHNWALGWHQDRTIALRERIALPGFDQWAIKSGILHAVPPFHFLERMLTARIHLDPADADNAPLRIAPASHRLGPIPEDRIAAVVEQCGEMECLADSGDLWLFATPILHASARASVPRRRRVLQILYSADRLPGSLRWLGI
jgi:ectoine hydroxylase-related dioxygenase (phytanoyl-CoA dioxygenase family)